jgi:hypothetical protein
MAEDYHSATDMQQWIFRSAAALTTTSVMEYADVAFDRDLTATGVA